MRQKITAALSISIVFLLCFSNYSIANEIFFNKNNKKFYIYYNYEKMTLLLQDLVSSYPDIMSLQSIGKTYEGRELWLVKLSDNVILDEDEPGVLLLGAHHGNEKPSYEVIIYFIKYIIENYYKGNVDDDKDGLLNEDDFDGFDNDGDGLIDEDPSEDRMREVINNTQIFLIPMVNPDGVEFDEAGSRKNRVPNHGPLGFKKEVTSYGVNLNRNYGYDWFYYYLFPLNYNLFFNMYDKSPNYRGPYPFSENETKAIKKFVETHKINFSISYHTFGELIFFPWYHTSMHTPDEDLFISIGENISKINKYRLLVGNDYKIPRFVGTLGTVENWLYGKFRIIAFTIELCETRAPTNPSIVLDTCYNNIGVILYICEKALSLK
ncbi:MAG: M14 family metallopeptidase [Thermoplasmatota archaeon]|jgi:carboxypeptidase T